MEKRASLNLSLFALIPTIFITFLVLVLGLSGCANKQNSSSTLNNVNTASCPSQPINVLASINQWGSLVKQIGGVCVNVTSIISSTNIEAHNYEPTANNIIEFNNNQLIVINGAGYDDWAKKAAEQVKSKTLIDVGEINNVKSGNNPHLFYSLKYIKTAINIISNKLISLNPDLKNFFSEQTKSVEKEYNYLTEKIQQTSDKYTSNNSKKRKVVVTETIADYLLNDLKFDNITPLGYLQSVSNEGEPTAEDLNSFRKLLNSKTPNLFILNTQEENNTTEQLSSAAQNNNIKIIKITESMPEKYTSLNQWLESVIEQIVD